MPISILLADDHTILREGLRALLADEKDMEVIGEAKTGAEVLDKAWQLHPDVIVLDINLPDLSGLEVTRQICRAEQHPRVVILSMYDKEPYVAEALANGASAYVLKGSESLELLEAIRLAVQGRHYLSPPLSEMAIQSYIQQTKSQGLDRYETLTNRERMIFQMAAEGLSSNEIARRLGISYRTVDGHRSKICSKLGVHNQTELVRYAIQHKIIPLDDDE